MTNATKLIGKLALIHVEESLQPGLRSRRKNDTAPATELSFSCLQLRLLFVFTH